MSSSDSHDRRERCRILVIGALRSRIAKVKAIIDEEGWDQVSSEITVEYLPCVARFDTYRDEQGNSIRYLVGIDYFPSNNTDDGPQSLLPFFDESADSHDDNGQPLFTGISGAVVGSGIEGDDDINRISSFLKTISSGKPIVIDYARPQAPYVTMKEELAAYKALDPKQREELSQNHTMGPGKMAKFAFEVAKAIIDEAIAAKTKETSIAANDDRVKNLESRPAEQSFVQDDINPDQNRYSCRKCRTILFGEEDLQYPKHMPSRHHFSAHKSKSGATSSECQSYFLQNGLNWMGDLTQSEGKFNCPRCTTKIGVWHWSGAQCSCGTWVVPAIQVPKSKVDLVLPLPKSQPICTAIRYT